MTEHISLDIADGFATITLDRPDALNAFTDLMEAELIQALEDVDADDQVRAVILTGAGRAFCAGMDLTAASTTFDEWAAGSAGGEAEAMPRVDGGLRRDGGGRVVLRMFELCKPIIAAINGPAVGVGLTMTLAADFRIAVPATKLGLVFTRRGLVPESCSSWFLPRLVGMQQAFDWVYSGRVFSSEEAHDVGLLRSLHEPDSLLDAAREIAKAMTESSAPVSVALSRQMLWRMAGATHPMFAHQIETKALNLRGISDDAREGISAFVEKRAASFTDKVSDHISDVFASYPPPTYQRQVLDR